MEFVLGLFMGWFSTRYWHVIKPCVLDVAARIPWIDRKLK